MHSVETDIPSFFGLPQGHGKLAEELVSTSASSERESGQQIILFQHMKPCPPSLGQIGALWQRLCGSIQTLVAILPLQLVPITTKGTYN